VAPNAMRIQPDHVALDDPAWYPARAGICHRAGMLSKKAFGINLFTDEIESLLPAGPQKLWPRPLHLFKCLDTRIDLWQ
jgi:hypothetical protein